MWKIDEILLKGIESTVSDLEKFIKADYFSKLGEKQRKIITLKKEIMEINIEIFNECILEKGRVRESDYWELLESTFEARKYLTDYQRKLLEDGDV